MLLQRGGGGPPMTEALAEVRDVTKYFPLTQPLLAAVQRKSKDVIHAVERVSVAIGPGEPRGLAEGPVSGKPPLVGLCARLHEPTSGTVRLGGRDISHLEGSALRDIRRRVQIVFQDPVGSLDPRLRAWQIVGEPLQALEHLGRPEVRDRVAALLPTVGLPAGSLDQYPHEFSGGGRQRLSLARALSVQPKLVILDEPTSALDVAVQAQILNRLVALQRELGLSYLLITHNVAAVRYVADRVAVMYLGKIAELGGVRDVLERPLHPYTKALLAAIPQPDPRRRRARYRIGGEVPTLVHPPPRCRFPPRCPFVIDRCIAEDPPRRIIPGRPGRAAACHRAEEVGDVPPEQLLVSPETQADSGSPGAG